MAEKLFVCISFICNKFIPEIVDIVEETKLEKLLEKLGSNLSNEIGMDHPDFVDLETYNENINYPIEIKQFKIYNYKNIYGQQCTTHQNYLICIKKENYSVKELLEFVKNCLI